MRVRQLVLSETRSANFTQSQSTSPPLTAPIAPERYQQQHGAAVTCSLCKHLNLLDSCTTISRLVSALLKDVFMMPPVTKALPFDLSPTSALR